MQEVKGAWQIYIDSLEENFSNLKSHLNKPVSDKDIEEAEEVLGFSLPQDLVQLYSTSNGCSENLWNVLGAYSFISLKEMVSEWETNRDFFREDHKGDMEMLEEINSGCMSVPEDAIKHQYINNKWLPITRDYSGNFLAYDLDPGENGDVGQIITCGRDFSKKYVIAENLYSLIGYMFENLEAENLTVIDGHDRQKVVFENGESNLLNLFNYNKNGYL